ncbi:amino acid ABC transporter permease [Paenibacillus hodogayensis]|uniref:Amino acid ABC transporter permease n=1 Tax=Paenibacillus hodogayensis TaxID=279208 RepID=A0ABV5VRA5_9BACL
MLSSNDSQFWTHLLKLADKLPATLFMMIVALAGGLLLGLLLAIVRIRRYPVLSALATLYLSFMRCTPTLVQLFLVFYGLPQLVLLFGMDINGWSNMSFAIITFALHAAAVLSEVIRSAYLAVGRSQQEAAYSVGMSAFQTLRRIVLPQAFGIALPNLANNAISLLKETSLAFSIGVIDVMGQAELIVGNNYGIGIVSIYITISVMYWIVSMMIGRAASLLESAYKKGHVGLAK